MQNIFGQFSEILFTKVNNRFYAIADMKNLVTAQEKDRLLEQGLVIHEYLDGTRYLVSCIADYFNNMEDRNIEFSKLTSENKLSESIAKGDFCYEKKQQKLTIQFLPLLKSDDILLRCNQLGIEVSRMHEAYRLLLIETSSELIHNLANEPWVQFISCTPEKGVPEDREGRSMHRVNLIGQNDPSGIDLDGEGVNVLVRDDGPVGPHIDFNKRLVNLTYGADGTHGDGVAGIIGGAANVDPVMEGMAPRCKVYVINYQDDFLDNTMNLHLNEGVVITNSSYSNGCNAGYTYITQIVDKQGWENPTLLHCFSAGNSNNLECGYGAGNQWGNITGGHKIGKNVITAANLNIMGAIESSSSRGPTRDGRLKPDISARGTNQNSTDPNNTYQVFGGTSAASPGVAGTATLLYQAYKKEHRGNNPPAALIKATLMNTATDLGVEGPDYIFGFGVLDGLRAYKLLKEKRYRELIAKNQETLEVEIEVPQNVAIAKFMIYWAEKEASLNARKVLINDIDLEVIDPDGNVILPWVPNPTADSSSLAQGARPGVDTLNNVEQVSIRFPKSGKYKIIIHGKFLPDINVPLFLLYDFPENKLELTSPIGGEKFATSDPTNLYFRSYVSDTILIEFSPNGGNTWSTIKRVLGTSKLTNWTTPATVNSDSCKIRLTQSGNVSISDFFTITNPITSLRVEQFCPSELTLSWNKSSKDSFIVYSLQGVEMKELMRSDTNRVKIPITSRSEPLWYAVAGYRNGALSRRTKSITVPDTLVKCVVLNDISIKPRNEWINSREFISCDQFDKIYPEVWITNRNVNEVKSFDLKYRIGASVISETITKNLKYRDSVLVRLSNGILLDFNGFMTLPIWTELVTDEYNLNDTTFIKIENYLVSNSNAKFPLIENFDSVNFPNDWKIQNAIPNNSFRLSEQLNKDGIIGKVIAFSNNNYSYANQKLNLVSEMADLSTAVEPYFYLDYAYHKSSTLNSLYDTLNLEILDLCTGVSTSRLLFSGSEKNLYTISPTQNEDWIPTKTSDWRSFAIDLSLFKGKKVAIKISLVRGMFSNLYFDNFKIIEKLQNTPQISFTWTPDEGCSNTNFRFTGSILPSGSELNWSFGSSASSKIAIGNGPFVIRFSSGGSKTVIVSSKLADQTVISTKDLKVYIFPQVSFDQKIGTNNSVAFENFSTQIKELNWDFGDGTFSNELNPIHVFPESKVYNVTLSVTNPCGTNKLSRLIDLSQVAVKNLDRAKIQIAPNPTNGIVNIAAESKIHSIELLAINGTTLIQKRGINETLIKLNLSGIESGIYILKLGLEDQEFITKLIVDRY
ncbi:MAG: S8 family serine peptidase [Saprospiraceae bacterium]|nr:S8 family serine peptidase [Saprospiraceae bacterium]